MLVKYFVKDFKYITNAPLVFVWLESGCVDNVAKYLFNLLF